MAIVALDSVYVTALSIDLDDEIHPSRKALISYFKVNETSTKVFSKYADFANIFSLKSVSELPKHTKINDHAIKLVDDWQLLYSLIYSLEPVKLKTLKA